MSAILERLKTAGQTGERLEFAAVRQAIHAEHEAATTTSEREMLLALHHLFLNETEAVIPPENLPSFRETRLQDYHLLLIREAVVGENICTDTLNGIVEREVEAGRMSVDDELRATAISGMAATHYSRAELEAIAAAKAAGVASRSASPPRGWRRLVGRMFGK